MFNYYNSTINHIFIEMNNKITKKVFKKLLLYIYSASVCADPRSKRLGSESAHNDREVLALAIFVARAKERGEKNMS